jgi:PAS domain S-box-containing protein
MVCVPPGGGPHPISVEELLELILRHTPDPLMLKTEDSRFLVVNDALARHYGQSRDAMVGVRERDVAGANPEEVAAFEADTRRVACGTAPEVVVERATRVDGGPTRTYRSVKAPVSTARGERLALIVTQDISDLEATLEQLTHREATLEAILCAVASGTWEFHADTGRLVNDQRWLEIFGLSADEHDGHVDTFIARIHPEDREDVMAKVGAAIDGETDGYVSEHRMVRASDGATIWVKDAGRVVRRGPDGKAQRMVGAVVDITHLKAQQAELERSRAEAETASLAKSQFLANMSHEIRTPMTGVLGMLDHLAETALDDEQRDMVRLARSSAKGLLTILNDILDTSKLEAGSLKVEAIPFELSPLLDEVVALFRPRAEAAGVRLHLDVDAGAPRWVRGDPTRLRQILFNLVGNAVKFTREGEIALEVETHPRADEVSFRIRDTGIGIPPEALARLFERFAQVDDSTTRQFGGTGLGLSISKQLATLMGGDLEAESVEGAGSTFTLRIPLPPAEPRGPRAADADAPMRPAALRILLAEDVRVNQLVVTRLLERLGHTVAVASDGREALEIIQSEDFDVVLMDAHMPHLDGIETTRAIRALDRPQRQVPIVALTASAMVGDRERFLEAGMDAYASKPVDEKALLDAMARAIAARSSAPVESARPR